MGSRRNSAGMPLTVLAKAAARDRAKIFMLCLFHHDPDGEKAFPSITRCQAITGWTRPTVVAAIKDCEELTWIKRADKEARKKSRLHSIYEIDVPTMELKEFNALIEYRISKGDFTIEAGSYSLLDTGKESLLATGKENEPASADSLVKNIYPNIKPVLELEPKDLKPYIALEAFKCFWADYPNKNSKAQALKIWMRLNPSPQLYNEIIMALAVHKRRPQWVKDGGDFVPHASTWLNQRRWEDEVTPTGGSSNGSSRQREAGGQAFGSKPQAAKGRFEGTALAGADPLAPKPNPA